MKYVIKFFSEITIKSRPVRKRFVAQLADNLKAVLKELDAQVQVKKGWDKLEVDTAVEDPLLLAQMVEAMRNTAGITYILEVVDFPLPVGPVTSTSPRGRAASLETTGGRPSWSAVIIALGISLKTAPTPFFCIKKLARYRARPGIS